MRALESSSSRVVVNRFSVTIHAPDGPDSSSTQNLDPRTPPDKHGLQKIHALVRPGAGGAPHCRHRVEGRHPAAGEVSRQSAASHRRGLRTWSCQPERRHAVCQCEGRREGSPPRVRWN